VRTFLHSNAVWNHYAKDLDIRKGKNRKKTKMAKQDKNAEIVI